MHELVLIKPKSRGEVEYPKIWFAQDGAKPKAFKFLTLQLYIYIYMIPIPTIDLNTHPTLIFSKPPACLALPCHAMPCMGRVPCHCCHSTIWHPPSTPNCLSFLSKVAFLEQCFFLSILWCSQNGHDSQEDLAKFGYKIHMKIKKFKHPSTFVARYLNQCIEIWWFFLIFCQIWLLKISKRTWNLAIFMATLESFSICKPNIISKNFTANIQSQFAANSMSSNN